MNKTKKALLGTALAGAIVVGASAGSYAWFTASYDAAGTITNHTLTINNGTDNAAVTLFENAGLLAPGLEFSDNISIENTGTMDQILRVKTDLALYDGATNIGTPDKSAYEISLVGTFKRGATTYNINLTGLNAEALDDYLGNNKWLPDANGAEAENQQFKPGDKLDVALKVKLKESAGNEYQGLSLKGSVNVEARQDAPGNSQF